MVSNSEYLKNRGLSCFGGKDTLDSLVLNDLIPPTMILRQSTQYIGIQEHEQKNSALKNHEFSTHNLTCPQSAAAADLKQVVRR